jgi:gliding motility-associated-like protein
MTKLYKILLGISCFAFLFNNQAKASHLLGADIGWKYLGSDTFLVTATVYRDCNGVPMPAQNMIIYSCHTSDTINLIKTGGMNITPVCKNSCSRCGNSSCSFGLGIEEYIFSAKVNLKAIDPTCCKFKIVWVACCYGNVITTTTPGATGDIYYVDGMIDLCAAPTDNSPVFKGQPVMIFNINQCQTFSYVCSDPDIDGNSHPDSLVYLLDTALKLLDTVPVSVQYNTGFSYNHPLQVSNSLSDPCHGFNLDTNTGNLTFKATASAIGVVNVKVQEWGKDMAGKSYLKGYTHRSVTFFSAEYNKNYPPTLSGFNGSPNTVEYFCTGQEQCFTIDSDDPDAGDSVTVTGELPDGMTGALLSIPTGVKHPQPTFCWKPDSTQAGKTFQFVVMANDNACPLSGHTSKTYTIHVNPTPKASAMVLNLNCGNIKFEANPFPGYAISKYTWTGDDGLTGTGQTVNHHYRKAGNYHWKVTFYNTSGCSDTVSGSFLIPDYLDYSVKPEDSLICLQKNTSINIKSSASSGKPPYKYSWQSHGITLPDTTSSLKFTVTMDTVIIGFVKDGNGCTNWDTAKIRASNGGTAVKLIPPRDTIACYNQHVSLIAGATGGDAKHYVFSWNPVGLNGPKYDFNATHTQYLLIKATDGCTADSATVHVGVLPPLKVQANQNMSICAGMQINLVASGTGGKTTSYLFRWDHGLGTGTSKILVPKTSALYHVSLSDGCSDSDTTSVRVILLPRPKAGFTVANDTIKSSQTLQFINTSTGATNYSWYFGDSTTSTDSTPSHRYVDSGTYTVKLVVTGADGCKDSMIRKNYIHVQPGFLVFFPKAFTPNQDSLNECFGPKGSDIKGYTLEIFSRLGNTVYKGTGCWDGTFKGDTVPEGMYIYHITVTAIDGTIYKYSGQFYLML